MDEKEPQEQGPSAAGLTPDAESATGAVSGRYGGEEVVPGGAPVVLLELRIDVDSAYAHSPAMGRVSGDLYRTQPSVPPHPRDWVYEESWIVDRPDVSWQPTEVTITGAVRWWHGEHPSTTARIVIPRSSGSIGPAALTLSTGGESGRTFSCARQSPVFRQLELEVDVCESANKPPILPSYDTHTHATRPESVVQRTLTIEEAYREAGVDMTISPDHTTIDDSAQEFASWSPAELHDAMETHYSSFGQAWPAWRMWGLLAGSFDDPSTGGIMFDAAADIGGAGRGPERQGFAVFRDHSWFDRLPAGPPTTQEEAQALRQFLYTYVHEAGHAFNFLHSWGKNRPDSLSWMNYDWRYDQRHAAGSFWSNFELRFDDEELIHLRHGDLASVIMGGDAWASGGHMDAPPASALMQLGDSAPLELLLRAKSHFEFMEPVSIELRLRNLAEEPTEIDARLTPDFGTVAIFARRPDGRTVEFTPILCQLATPEVQTLAPAMAEDGSDRYSESVFVGYGAKGFLFDMPGEYLVRAVYQGLGDFAITSNTFRLRVGNPAGVEQDVFADEFFTDSVGLSLSLDGSQSPFLEKGMDTLARAREEFPGTMLAARASETLGRSAGRSFFRLEESGGDRAELVRAHAADPALQLDLTAPAVETFQQAEDPYLNLAYHQLARDRAEAFQQTDERDAANEELLTLAKYLKARGANESVLDDIRADAGGGAVTS